jgi:recombinational DNA repair protein (RecF pathway)
MSPRRLLLRENRVLTVAGVAAALSIIALCLLLVARVNVTREFDKQTVTNCRSVERLKEAIRATLMEGEARALARPELGPAQLRAIRQAYDREIARYAPRKCP